MADDDDYAGVEEEAADEKRKRRQQSQKPWELITPEEKAREAMRWALAQKLYEHDPKTGLSYYNRVWFCDLTTFDLDEESVHALCWEEFFRGDAYVEINLKIKEDEEGNDREFRKGLLDVSIARIDKVESKTLVSRLSVVQLVFAYVKKALEGTIEIKILSGPGVFHGKITACATDVPNDILLYDNDVGGTIAVGDDEVIQLLRRVVAVSVDDTLIFSVDARDGDQNANISSCSCKFTPLMKAGDEGEITCGLYKMGVKVVWSTLFAP